MSPERCLLRSDRGTVWIRTLARSTVFLSLIVMGFSLVSAPADASADDFQALHPSAKVIARLPISGGGIQQMFLRQDGRTRYLYVQRAFQPSFTIIDVTRPERPKVIRRKPLETLTVVASGVVATATPDKPATSDSDTNANDVPGLDHVPESIHVLNVSDPAHSPSLSFINPTSVVRDRARNLIYVADSEGVWILAQKRASHKHKCVSSEATSNLPGCD